MVPLSRRRRRPARPADHRELAAAGWTVYLGGRDLDAGKAAAASLSGNVRLPAVLKHHLLKTYVPQFAHDGFKVGG